MTAIGIFLAFIGLLIGAAYGAPLGAKYNFYRVADAGARTARAPGRVEVREDKIPNESRHKRIL